VHSHVNLGPTLGLSERTDPFPQGDAHQVVAGHCSMMGACCRLVGLAYQTSY
jgi:hypothetical protein